MKLLHAKLVLLAIILVCNSCYKEESIDPSSSNDDWSEDTHGETDPNYDMVFAQDEVKRIDITISAENWAIMKEDLDELMGNSGTGPAGASLDEDPVFVPATILFNELEWDFVGIRFKGNSSLKAAYQQGIDKFSFKLDFDEFEDTYPEITNQRFYGFKQLNLKNNINDNSYLREKIASDIFRNAGIPSPKTSFYRVFIDFGEGSTYFGLYTMVEEVDNTVIKTQFDSDEGNLYKPEDDGATFASGSYNESDMNKKTNETLADYSDVEELYNALNSDTRTTNVESWKTRLENILDVDAFMHWLAVNTVIQNWDTYGNMEHNYYLYNDPPSNKLVWIPWDNNEALDRGKMNGALSISLEEVNSKWPLIRYLMDETEYKDIYDHYVEETINNAFEPSKMKALYQESYNLIETYVIGSEGEIQGYTFLNSDADFTTALTTLMNHVDSRYSIASDYLK